MKTRTLIMIFISIPLAHCSTIAGLDNDYTLQDPPTAANSGSSGGGFGGGGGATTGGGGAIGTGGIGGSFCDGGQCECVPPCGVWSRSFGDANYQAASDVTADSSGNVLMVGYNRGTIDFGGGALVVGGSYDTFIAKFSPDGAHMWSKAFAVPTYNSHHYGMRGVTTDSFNNVLTAGFIYESIDFGGGPLTAAGPMDAFVAKLGSDGSHIWSKLFTNPSYSSVLTDGIAVDSLDGVVVTGSFTNEIDFGGGSLTKSGDGGFVVKLAPDGSHLWSHSFGPGLNHIGKRITVDSLDCVIVAIDVGSGALSFGGEMLEGSDDIAIVKYDANGNYIWSKLFVEDSGPYGNGPEGVAIDNLDNIIIAGNFSGTIHFGEDPLVNEGSSNLFVAKFDTAGQHLWSKRYGDPGSQVSVHSVAADTIGNVLVSGSVFGKIDFGGGQAIDSIEGANFIVKLDSMGNHVWSSDLGDRGTETGGSLAFDSIGNLLMTGEYSGMADFGSGKHQSVGKSDIFLSKIKP